MNTQEKTLIFSLFFWLFIRLDIYDWRTRETGGRIAHWPVSSPHITQTSQPTRLIHYALRSRSNYIPSDNSESFTNFYFYPFLFCVLFVLLVCFFFLFYFFGLSSLSVSAMRLEREKTLIYVNLNWPSCRTITNRRVEKTWDRVTKNCCAQLTSNVGEVFVGQAQRLQGSLSPFRHKSCNVHSTMISLRTVRSLFFSSWCTRYSLGTAVLSD